MEKNAHYLAVGIFVLVATGLGFLLASWLYDKRDINHTNHYEIHFAHSVDGLTLGSDVRYMGIRVGQVLDLHLLPKSADEVAVIVSIQEDTPISQSSVASLKMQGITGAHYVNIMNREGYSNDPLPTIEGSRYMIIPSTHSDISGFIQTLPKLQHNVSQLLIKAQGLLTEENLKNFSDLIANLNKLTTNSNKILTEQNTRNLTLILENLKQSSEGLNTLTAKLDNTLDSTQPEINGGLKDLRHALKQFAKTSQSINTLTQQIHKNTTLNEERLNELLAEGGNELKALLHETRKTAQSIRKLSEKLEDNPSRLIHKPKSEGTVLPPMKKLILIINLILLSGCSTSSLLESNEPVAQTYRLSPAATTTNNKKNLHLFIPKVTVATAIDNNKITLFKTATTQDFIANSQWPDKLSNYLHDIIIETLNETGKYQSVSHQQISALGNHKLLLHFSDFQAEYPSPTATHCTINLKTKASLIDVKTQKILMQKTYQTKQQNVPLRTSKIISAMNTSLEKLIKEVQQDL